MEEPTYDEVLARSYRMEDLEHIVKAWKKLRKLEYEFSIESGAISITAEGYHGFSAGELWWDSESEEWRWDPKNYGRE